MQLAIALDREWAQPATRRALRRRYPAWAQHHAELRIADSADELVTRLRRSEPQHSDPPLYALVTLAGHDQLAARVVLQALIPGLSCIARGHQHLAPNDELEATILAVAWEHIRTYPTERRPARVAANLLLDTAHHLRRQLRAQPQIPPEARQSGDLELNPSEELQRLVVDAVAEQRLSRLDAELVLRTRMLDEPIAHVAAACGYPANSVHHQRHRAERRLRGTA